ncbi:undecaprenyl-phosphate galactose phosphotransferase WbaP [Rubrobacter naiadicus]|uniref:undecaprenyl-phosphate galactose phosphotransferase WbaP n=1 Tax=Rubrobacter naiadicus TaxID=1392641 RepID=UPI002362C2BA|nr:undecaprenyl-phosphate galactose phosphotransferase WbaP [Rubrobacter naiadicus]
MRRAVAALSLGSVDLLLAVGVWLSARWVHIAVGLGPLSDLTYLVFVPGTVLWAGLRAAVGLYPGYGLSVVESLRRQSHATLVAGAVTVVFFYFLHIGDNISRLFVLAGFAGLLVLAPLARAGVRVLLRRGGLWGKPVLVVGEPEDAARVARRMREEWETGLIPVVMSGPESGPEEIAGAAALCRKRGMDTIVLAGTTDARLISEAVYSFRQVAVVSDPWNLGEFGVTGGFGGDLGVEIRHNLLRPGGRMMKRSIELFAAFLGTLILLPLFLLLAGLVWLESGRPVLYSDRRMGAGGRTFRCLKFRTMVPDAEERLQQVLREDPEAREEYLRYHKLRRDPRVTRVGRFLRRTSLDELPQLINVLRGEMSLVGPRPYLPRESADIGRAQTEILRVTPGITGLWQVSGRSELEFDRRVTMDLYYVRRWSIWLDLVILARTVSHILGRRGAF